MLPMDLRAGRHFTGPPDPLNFQGSGIAAVGVSRKWAAGPARHFHYQPLVSHLRPSELGLCGSGECYVETVEPFFPTFPKYPAVRAPKEEGTLARNW